VSIRGADHAYKKLGIFEVRQIERGLCIQFEVSEIYSEYYNFTLLDLLRTKKELE
jgi:hypothetical protein